MMSSTLGLISKVRSPLPQGTKIDLFTYNTVALVMINYKFMEAMDEDNYMRWMGLGVFTISIVAHVSNAIAAIFCSVDDFDWPLTKDMAIVRMGQRTFVIGMPGLLYALQLPSTCEPTDIAHLEKLFRRFAHYTDFIDFSHQRYGYPVADNDSDVWRIMGYLAKPIAHDILTSYHHSPGLSRFSVLNHNSCFLRAIRMSASVKTIVNAILSGALYPSHRTIHYNDTQNNVGSSPYASISVFTCLVDALEASFLVSQGWASLVMKALPPLHSYPDPGFKVWRLNEYGFVTFMRNLESTATREAQIIGTNQTRIPFALPNILHDDRSKDKGKQVIVAEEP